MRCSGTILDLVYSTATQMTLVPAASASTWQVVVTFASQNVDFRQVESLPQSMSAGNVNARQQRADQTGNADCRMQHATVDAELEAAVRRH
ncbi:hypothetical protein BDZ85DRAFT_261360 [Elsinoe ampelina]|uniref:Uncharacterized protein n=1 Tax=Elsinoe ampelina TaxID=302913 RepID=A0A6A6GC64_9PEZI|nr:hypothetical protein BDZ85DRAFT_261360 [Elsinoe ampelina]